jgi:hypothetical protein
MCKPFSKNTPLAKNPNLITMHPLKLTNGAAMLLSNMLSVPEHLKTTSAILTAAKLIERIEVSTPDELTNEWADQEGPSIELTERERDLCKTVVEALAGKIPPTKHAVSILTQLGFTE